MADHGRSLGIPLPGWKDFVAGSFAGMAQVAVGHPLDTVKTRLQLDNSGVFKGPWDCITRTVREEGILGLYKGMAAPLAGVGFVNAVLFSAYGWFKHLFQDPRSPDRPLHIRELAAAGSGAGIVNAAIASPIELFKIRLQTQHVTGPGLHRGPLDVAKALIKAHGWRGVFHGTWSTVVREIPAYAGFYGGFEYAKRVLSDKSNPSANLPVSRLMVAGAFGGIMYWVCCYPLDVAKTRIQQRMPGMGSTSVLPTLKEIHTESGFKGLYRGFVTTVIRSMPAAAATFTVYELAMRFMGGP